MEIKSWQVKHTGKFQMFLTIFTVSLIAYLLIINYSLRREVLNNVSYWESFVISFWSLLYLLIIWYISLIPFILKKKIPISLKVDDHQLQIQYPKSKKIEIPRSDLAFSFNYGFFYRLIIYQKAKSHSGRWAYVKKVKILGFPFGDTWTNPKLKQLADDFSDLKIEFKKTNSNIISDFLD
jgi:hypothetical protein